MDVPSQSWPERSWTGPPAVRETHTAVVFLVADRAYKLKKPVDLGFLDFSTPDARHRACRRELELNRRIAPDVYLDLATVTGEDGTVLDHVVVMRRMPDARRLARLVRAGEPVEAEIRQVARLVATFHAGARRGPDISREGGRDALRGRWEQSFAQVRPFRDEVLDAGTAQEVERLALRYLAGREELFAGRARDGRIVDGHGDLLADDVFCLPDGPRVLDCLEFDDRLRYLDQLDDAAFLAMDLESLGAAASGRAFLDAYREFSGDPAPASLQEHYLAYRAFVRAKVGCLRHAQGDPDAGPRAAGLLGLAVSHLRAGAVRLVLVGGLPGTGSSTLAGALADRLGMVLLSSDRVRKELAGLSPRAPAPAAFEQELYSTEHTAATYGELLHRARAALIRGEPVVVDASWNASVHRDAARALAERTSSDLVELRCDAPAEVTTRRLSERSGRSGSGLSGSAVSDADAAIAAAMAARTDPWPEAVVVDTTGPVEESVRQGMAAFPS